MARDHARINLTIWGDPEFRALPRPAQHLYLILWTHPDLSYCGALEWRPGKLSGLTADSTRADVQEAADCLQARHFIVVDHETEEALIRSWIRWDGLMKQPRMAVSCITAYGNLGSEVLRQALVHELQQLRERNPELSAWGDDRVAQILTHPARSAKELTVPADPYLDPHLDLGLPQSQVEVCTPSTPAPAPAPIAPSASQAKRRAPERPIPETWKPTQGHQDYAHEHNLDLSSESFRFRNHALANDRRQRDWDAAFRMWLSKAKPVEGKVEPRKWWNQ